MFFVFVFYCFLSSIAFTRALKSIIFLSIGTLGDKLLTKELITVINSSLVSILAPVSSVSFRKALIPKGTSGALRPASCLAGTCPWPLSTSSSSFFRLGLQVERWQLKSSHCVSDSRILKIPVITGINPGIFIYV